MIRTYSLPFPVAYIVVFWLRLRGFKEVKRS